MLTSVIASPASKVTAAVIGRQPSSRIASLPTRTVIRTEEFRARARRADDARDQYTWARPRNWTG
ncbi:hypothetical protein, partial [Streptomyces wuyuanensis]|uniref:hypothetical protein n=1 Tax=Streptomyces wuyuanensis TaxID=1196353 RepID=UPI003D758E81